MIDEDYVLECFSKQLTERMKESGISDRKLALYCHISEVNIPGYRDGDRLPNLWYLVLIAECLECSVNDLLGFGKTKYSSALESQKASYTFFSKKPIRRAPQQTNIAFNDFI